MATNDHPPTALGEYLTNALALSGLSQSLATQQAGVSMGTWANLVYGGRELHGTFSPTTPKAHTVAKVAYAVGADIDQALKLAGYPGSTVLPTGEPMLYDLSLVTDKQLWREVKARRPKYPELHLVPTEALQAEVERRARESEEGNAATG
jgi:hypothetical protein